MCWVMPPASPAATSVSRIASSSEVLPWSTWPMIVTTGGARLELLVGVLELRLVARLVGGVDDLDLLVELVGEDLDRVVGQRLRERGHLAQAHQLLDDLRDRDAEVLGDVLDRRAGVDPDDVGLQRRDVLRGRLLVGCRDGGGRRGAAGGAMRAAGPAAGTAAGPAGPAARGLRVDHDAAHAAGGAGGALALQRGARRALAALAAAVALARRRLAVGRPSLRACAVLRPARRLLRRPAWRAAGAPRGRWRAVSVAGRSKPMPVCCGARGARRPACRWPPACGGLPVSARSATSSSTADADALTSRP